MCDGSILPFLGQFDAPARAEGVQGAADARLAICK
jgi:hypothetical protein